MTAVKYMSCSHRFRTYSHPQAERKVGRVHIHEFGNNYRHNIMRQLRENILHLPTQTCTFFGFRLWLMLSSGIHTFTQ